jgi:uncharacterized protein YqhQ
MENIGGQAVIEGVMFKNKENISIAIRKPNGEIKVKVEPYKTLTKKKPFSLPFIRGIITLVETMIEGIKALNYSTNENLGDTKEEQLSPVSMIFSFIISMALAILLFKFIPLFTAQVLNLGNTFTFNLIEGLIKIAMLVGYIWIISFLPDVRTLYQYHGAEHKVINAHENKDLENAKKYSTLHPRCGTSFLVLVVFISIIVYIIIPMNFTLWIKLLLRLALLPVIAGIAYELIKLSGKHRKNKLLLAFISPGLLLQKITTKEPTEKQLEVSMAAFNALKQ